MAGQPPSERARLTPLAWGLIVLGGALVVVLLVAKRGTLAVLAFLGLALIVLVVARALLPPSARRRQRIWGGPGGRAAPLDPPDDEPDAEGR